jgi:uracil-DNA glycosylase
MLISEIVNKLKNTKITGHVTNQYSQGWIFSDIACNNIRVYFELMMKQHPSDIFVGEAPGYNGCKLTGVPFTSEKIIIDSSIPIFGLDKGYLIHNHQIIQGEPTSTIVWETLKPLKYYPLFWNAFPFHPHAEINRESNRRPDKNELTIGRDLLSNIIELFQIERVFSIGNVAYETLQKMGISTEKIRHPVHGGKNEFCTKVREIVCRI